MNHHDGTHHQRLYHHRINTVSKPLPTITIKPPSPRSYDDNPARNWGQDRTATITLDGRKPDKAIDIRQGLVTRANGVKALVVWIEHTRTAPLEIGIE